MYLTAHRFRNPDGQQGFNAFLYSHGDIPAPTYAWIKMQPPPGGTLVRSQGYDISPQEGNRVRSFLELVAPDDLSPAQLWPAIESALRMTPASLPHQLWHSPVSLRFNMEQQLATIWSSELVALAWRAISLVESEATQKQAQRGG